MRTLPFRIQCALVVVANAAVSMQPSRGDGAGGTVSPYGISRPVTLESVTILKKSANELRFARFTNPELPTLSKAGFVRMGEPAESAKPRYAIVGKLRDGGSKELQLGFLESLTVRERDANAGLTLCEVVVFPALTPKKLLQLKPSYSTLVKDYRKTLMVWLDTGKSADRQLAIVGNSSRDRDPSAAIWKRVSLNSLPIDSTIFFEYRAHEFERDALWWAIPSVIADRKYPHRLITAA